MANVKPIKYDKVLTLKVDDEILTKIDFIAKETGKKRSEIIRDLITKKDIKITTNNSTKRDDKKLLYELNKIGNNINQIAYILNVANNQDFLDDVDYKNILEQLQLLNIQLKQTLQL